MVTIVKKTKKKYYTKTNPATKVFQALRIFVNKEISELTRGLKESANIVSQNGVILTVSFHSLEDKICKFFFNYLTKQDKVSRYLPEKKSTKISFSLITKKPVIPGSQELKLNPPSRSAKLRAIKKLDTYENNKNVFLKYKNLLNIEKFSEKLLPGTIVVSLLPRIVVALVETSLALLTNSLFTTCLFVILFTAISSSQSF